MTALDWLGMLGLALVLLWVIFKDDDDGTPQ